MITWMQKHKKYLIITIWISTIAFIAAGMVGWGAYSFSSSSNSVAKVGNIAINVDDFNREYQLVFNNYNKQYSELMGKPLDNEQAKLLGLENITIQRLINKALLENFALDSGIRISNDDVTKEIQNIENFKKDGVFSSELYKEILKQNRIKPSEFEENMRKDLLIQKILGIFPTLITPFEKDIMSLPVALEDRLAIQIITSNQIKINIRDSELKDFYEKNKESYKTKKTFEVEILKTAINDISTNDEDLLAYYNDNKSSYITDGRVGEFNQVKDKVESDFKTKEAQKNALKLYVDFKNGKINGDKQTITEDDINSEILQAINGASDGETIKPILDNENFITIKVIKKIPQIIKSFEEAKNNIKADYYPIARQEALKKEAESKLNVFAGVDIGFFSLNDIKPIPLLQNVEKQQLLANIFNSSSKNGFVILNDKVVLYRILEQKMLRDSNNLDIFNDFKSRIIEQTIIDFLTKEYKIINNLKKDV